MLEQPSLECKCGGAAAVCMCYEDMEIGYIIPSPVAITPQIPGSTGIFKSSTVYRIYIHFFNGADILISNRGRNHSHGE